MFLVILGLYINTDLEMGCVQRVRKKCRVQEHQEHLPGSSVGPPCVSDLPLLVGEEVR